MSYKLSYLENFHYSNFQHLASKAANKFDSNICSLWYQKTFLSYYFLLASIKGMEIDLSLVKFSCQCQKYETCAWSTQVVNQMAVIPKNMPLWKSLFQSFVVQICDRKERLVWCCRGGEQARGSELEILNRKPDENENNVIEVNKAKLF